MPLAPTAAEHVDRTWDGIVPVLHDYIAIPNISRHVRSGLGRARPHAAAVELVADWCTRAPIAGLPSTCTSCPAARRVIVVEVPAADGGAGDDTVLLYGHLDKQPEMDGWRDGLGPWTPVLEGDRLYGRGGADDGYCRVRRA